MKAHHNYQGRTLILKIEFFKKKIFLIMPLKKKINNKFPWIFQKEIRVAKNLIKKKNCFHFNKKKKLKKISIKPIISNLIYNSL